MPNAIVLLPPHQHWPAWTGHVPADAEDLERPYRLLAARGLACGRADLNPYPLNPFARAHPVLRAIDPVRALRVLWRERDAKLVVGFFESSVLVILLLRRLFRFRAKVLVVDLGTPEWRLRRLILDRVVPRADAILPYSAAQARAIRETWPEARLVVPVQAQVDATFFGAAPDQADGPVLAIGDDVSRDYPTLIAAAPAIARPVRIRSRAAFPTELPANVTRLTEALPLPAYRDLIAAACIVVLPLHPVVNGGGTSVLVQAMASGKAVVVSASPGVLDYVEDGETALVVPCHDAAALAAAVTRLLDDPTLRQRLGCAARERAVRFNSYDAWADTLEAVARRLQTPVLP